MTCLNWIWKEFQKDIIDKVADSLRRPQRMMGGTLELEQPLKEQEEGVIPEPRDIEIPCGGLPEEQWPLCERLNPTGILEERGPVS